MKIRELILASNNSGKILEIKALLPDVNVVTMREMGFMDEIPEPFHTFRENAAAKAIAVYNYCGNPAIADDSGLCVDVLGGRPGVESAHYSGTRNDVANTDKVLRDMEGQADRKAFYFAVICLVMEGNIHYFEGTCHGRLLTEKRGDGGFGYDPIFVPDGCHETFAELSAELKSRISHRAKALGQLKEYIS